MNAPTLYGVPDAEVAKPTDISLNTPVCKLLPPGRSFYLFVISVVGSAYDRVIIAKDPSGHKKIAELSSREWSSWLLESFQTVGGVREGTLRFRLEKLSSDAKGGQKLHKLDDIGLGQVSIARLLHAMVRTTPIPRRQPLIFLINLLCFQEDTRYASCQMETLAIRGMTLFFCKKKGDIITLH